MSPHFAVVQCEMYVLLSRKMLLFGMFLAQQTFSPAIRSLANLRLQVTKHSNEIAFRLVRIAGQGRSVSIKKKKKKNHLLFILLYGWPGLHALDIISFFHGHSLCLAKI